MFVIKPAEHLQVGRPLRERDGCAVNADEPFPVVVHEGQEVGLLLVVHFQGAAGIEEHGVEVIQRLGVVFQLRLRQRFGVRADYRIPQSRFAPESLDCDHRMRHGLMPIAFLFPDHEESFPGGCALRHDRCAEGAGQRQSDDEARGCHDCVYVSIPARF